MDKILLSLSSCCTKGSFSSLLAFLHMCPRSLEISVLSTCGFSAFTLLRRHFEYLKNADILRRKTARQNARLDKVEHNQTIREKIPFICNNKRAIIKQLTVVSVQGDVSSPFVLAIATVLGARSSPHCNVVYPFVPLPPTFSSRAMVGACIHPPGRQSPKSTRVSGSGNNHGNRLEASLHFTQHRNSNVA
jgi:hypothetical protein